MTLTNQIDFIRQHQQRVDKILATKISAGKVPAKILHAALEYSLLAPGKRLRPLLVYATAYAVEAPNWDLIDNAAAAVEMIHAYSLIHDDLPAMDNSQLRRGQATCHCKFDEATAILAGDALQALAFQQLTLLPQAELAQPQLKMINLLTQASGAEGMVAGQCLDMLALKNSDLDEFALAQIYQLKTGALLKVCCELAACTVNLSASKMRALNTFSHNFALAFQIQDDLLDLESPSEISGKTQGLDAQRNLPTYPQILGTQACKNLVESLYNEAIQTLNIFADPAQYLLELVKFSRSRIK